MSHTGQGTAPPSSWERRHPGHNESWFFDFFMADGSLGGFVGLVLRPKACAWYWAGLVGAGRPYVLVRDLEVVPPRLATSREIRSEGLWADINCETPFDHWSLGLEAFAVAMDDPDEALAAEWGDRTGLGFDLEWEAVGDFSGAEGSYAQPGIVHGEVLVGGTSVETVAFDGQGWRRHAWRADEPVLPSRAWLGGRLDDGTPHRSDPLTDDVVIEPLQRAPFLVEAEGGLASVERVLCRFSPPPHGPGQRSGTGWAEWLREVPAS